MLAKSPAQGAILLTVFLFNIIIASLILLLLQNVTLERRKSIFFRDRSLALINAENSLKKKERMLQQGIIPENVEIISQKICGVTFYRLFATGQAGAVTKIVQSSYAKMGDFSLCDGQPQIVEGRKSWREY